MTTKMIRKGGLIERAGINVEKGLVPARVSVLEVDRDREVTLPQSFRHREGLRDFKTNPVVFFGHQSFGLPIGRSTKIRLADDHIAATTKMAIDVEGSYGDHVRGIFDLMKGGELNAWSIGFWYDESVTDKDAMREVLDGVGNDAAAAVARQVESVFRIFTKSRLAEYSAVGIGSSPSSLTERAAKGLLTPEIKELLEFGAKYDVSKDDDWREWLFYTEGQSIDVDASSVLESDVTCAVEDACIADIEPIIVRLSSAGSVERHAPTKQQKQDDDNDIQGEKKRPQKLESKGVTPVWFDGGVGLEIALDEEEHGEKLVVPLDKETLTEIVAKANELETVELLEELVGNGESHSQSKSDGA